MNPKNLLYIGAIVVVVLIIKQSGFGGFLGTITGSSGESTWTGDCNFGTSVQNGNYIDGTWIFIDDTSFGYVRETTKSGVYNLANSIGTTFEGYHIFRPTSYDLYVAQQTTYTNNFWQYSTFDLDKNDVDTCTPACNPDCSGKECGGDGCGGTCGTCVSGETCSAGQCITDCQSLKSNFLSAVTTWANNPTSTLKSTALQKLVDWANGC